MRLTVLLLAASSFAADWPSFRGPNGSGVSNATSLPTEFGPKQNVVWRTPLPPGAASPVLTEDAIFLTAAENSQLLVLKSNRANGQILWRLLHRRRRMGAVASKRLRRAHLCHPSHRRWTPLCPNSLLPLRHRRAVRVVPLQE